VQPTFPIDLHLNRSLIGDRNVDRKIGNICRAAGTSNSQRMITRKVFIP
jgi:hypothetical protein